MGGNTRAIDRETGAVLAHADRIDLRRTDRRHFKSSVCDALAVLDNEHLTVTDQPLWPDSTFASLITEGYAFNGSSEHLFGAAVSDADLVKYKPVFGDIDVTIPHERLESLFEVLARFEQKKLTDRVTYIGQNKPEQHGHQINALFQYEGSGDPLMVQIDFEGTEYIDGKPTAFSKFAHSSAWDDAKLGLKGVGHKYWMINLVRAISENMHIVQLTDKSPMPPLPVRLKKMASDAYPRTHAFSVDRGLRNKMKSVVHDGKPLRIDGKIAVQELPTSQSEYIRDLPSIFLFLFDREATADKLKKMWSLSGLVDLCVKYVPEHKLANAYLFMLSENMFGQAAQKLDRVSKMADEEVKMKIVNHLRKHMPFLKDFDSELNRVASDFYARY